LELEHAFVKQMSLSHKHNKNYLNGSHIYEAS
jgi:hypothetical protein